MICEECVVDCDVEGGFENVLVLRGVECECCEGTGVEVSVRGCCDVVVGVCVEREFVWVDVVL